jgi:hypothetical protein
MAMQPNPVPERDPRYPERAGFAFDGACKVPKTSSSLKWPAAAPPPPPPPPLDKR